MNRSFRRALRERRGSAPEFGAPARALALAMAMAALGAATGVRAQAAGSPAITVPTVAVEAAADGSGFTLDGSLQAQRQSTLGAQTGGNVLELAVKAGDRVKAGQWLVRIDDREAQAALAAANAGVTQADAGLRNARVAAERARELRTQGFVSQAALDQAETQLRAANAGLEQARAGRAQAALARAFTTVAAPFDAVVQATHVEPGDLAVLGRPLLTVYAPGAMRAVVQVPASRAALARAATDVTVIVGHDGGVQRLRPVRRTELPAADPVSQTVEWRLDLAPADSRWLAPGGAVTVSFAGATAPAGAAAAPTRPVVPTGAVLRRGELTAVYAAVDGRFVLKVVRLGATLGERVEVVAGLAPGDRIAQDAVRAGLAGAVPAGY